MKMKARNMVFIGGFGFLNIELMAENLNTIRFLMLVFFGGVSARAQNVCPQGNDLEMYVDTNVHGDV